MPAPSRCPSCSSPLPAGNSFCGSCGQRVLGSSTVPTVNLPSARPSAGAELRFVPGSVLADRYRIVGLLGKGGMGEVYRADDLKLGQSVALKFLPPGFDADPERLQRFLREVRIARQVSHANVCRIYDAGEAGGQHFLSMEYIDGDDLASLLRRIGHVPKTKAVEFARQICAGLAAAHETGILHRDLKPANIMIDGRGRARITDFGLAAVAEETAGQEILSGTPAYMAPEQLAGQGVSVQSDLYSLGLVLYELFTGKRAFQASSAAELRRLQSETTPSSPSSFMEGFDPAVERVILRCLEADPARRPSSALSVAAALPGGDPLAAALAAGETPSPELVAEARDHGAVSPALAWAALGVFFAALAAVVALAPRTSLLAMVRLDKPPEVLQERAREILARTGHDRRLADSLFMFDADRAYLDELVRRKELDAGKVLRSEPPSAVLFWYREGPSAMARWRRPSIGEWMSDPPNIEPGMARVGLDPAGRLRSLLIVPEEWASPATASPGTDWTPLLRATGIDETTLAPVAPQWAPPVFAETRAAWTASWPGRPELPLRIEAAAAGGRPVSLRVVEPWAHPGEESAPAKVSASRAPQFLQPLLFVVVIVVAGFLAVRNVRRGRGDRRGALRLALYLGAARMLWFLGAHHVASSEEGGLFDAHLSYALMRVGVAYVFYLAIEPYARRLWPRMLVSWVRVLEGRFRDPLVGQHLLIGCAVGAIYALLQRLQIWLPQALGGDVGLPAWSHWTFESLRGAVPAFVSVVGIHTQELLGIIYPLTLLLIFRLLLRRTGLALVAVSLVAMALFYPESGSLPVYVIVTSLSLVLAWLALFRVGLLALATSMNVSALVAQLPLTPRPAGWYAGVTLLSLACIVGLAVYGFWISRAGRRLLRYDVLEPA